MRRTTSPVCRRSIAGSSRSMNRSHPFDLRVPGVLDAYAEALEGWGEALAWLRGVVDFSSDLRSRPY